MKEFPFVNILLLIVCNVFLSCQEKIAQDSLAHTFVLEMGMVNPSIKGVWKSIGEGYIWDATNDSLKLYSYTDSFCYKERNNYLEGLLNSEAQFIKRGKDTLYIYYEDYKGETKRLNNKRIWVQIDQLPSNCISLDEIQKSSPGTIFKLFVQTFKENYAFSTERNLDWEEISRLYSPKITHQISEDSLFQLLGEIVVQTQDHHTKIFDKDGTKIQYSYVPTSDFVSEAFKRQDQVKEVGEFFNLFFETSYQNITDSLLQGEGHKEANEKIEWGSINEDIGYIVIYLLAGFGSAESSRAHQIDVLNAAMTEAIDALESKKAMIVDLSFNFGGFSAAEITAARYFTDKEIPVYTLDVFQNGTFYPIEQRSIIPSQSVQFTKPTYVLMTDITRSGAETFSLAMRAFPHVTLVGTNTLGIQSGMLNKTIGNFHLTLSNQRNTCPDGRVYEKVGVPPDIRLEVLSRENTLQSHKEAVYELVNMIEAE